MQEIEVAYSTPTTAAIAALLGERYDLGAVTACRLLHRSLSDSFLVEAAQGRFVCRVSRAGWRSFAAVENELAAIRHLGSHGVPVAAPIAARDGDSILRLRAPEGERLAVLFPHLPGRWARPDEAESAAFGTATARLHAASEGLPQRGYRALDLDHLLREPVAQMMPFLDRRPEERAALAAFAARLEARLEALPLAALDRGFCHGDLYEENALVSAESVGLVDFDCCGFGWRAYDLAVFRWRWAEHPEGEALWRAFLRGYRTARGFAERDAAAVALFVPLRAIWLRGLHCATAEDWGVSWLNEPYWDRFFAFLAAWEARALD
jgi:Ser/Thr protein kinase RdoA (MazF antagonist)